MAGEKMVTYTAEQTAELVERYTDGESVEVLAAAFGKTARSVIAKLSREGVYKSKQAAEGTGPKRMTKAEYLASVEQILNMAPGSLDSMEKGTLESCKALYTVAMKVTAV